MAKKLDSITVRIEPNKKVKLLEEAKKLDMSLSEMVNDHVDLLLLGQKMPHIIKELCIGTLDIINTANSSKDEENRIALLKRLEGLQCLLLKL